MIPVIEPFLIFIEQFETAARPPKYLESFSTSLRGHCPAFDQTDLDRGARIKKRGPQKLDP